MNFIYETFAMFAEKYDINFSVIYSEYERTAYINGVLSTIELTIVSIFFSVLIGILGVWLQRSKYKAAHWFVTAYVQLFRNTPPLVQMLFFYFALGPLTPAVDMGGWEEPLIGGFGWAAVSLSLFCGAFNVEIFRSGIESVPKGMDEAATALGFNKNQSFFKITLPLAFRTVIPAFTNNLVNLLKTTTLAYAIAVPEIMYVSNQIWSDNLNVVEMMVVVFATYMILVGILVWLMHRIEHKLKLPGSH